ncbi:MFS general substrate transporter [Punctularia strigosozonata HHB-11173 SS5]|uniref:MFS general substrate transporter n=1 Tax=Punctularia strigosozonata (strain HHB-11173) TaxID=741275 RepID=UPI0004418528|nr:MFS general substrate transporter [Punctularia strigosozonata HHB-11173 SS5]EIN10403.1 MFS general substrate transporter [Punctularia strigosozonata HHB-11173 SS5]
MAPSPNANADEDPTTQIPWPSRSRRQANGDAEDGDERSRLLKPAVHFSDRTRGGQGSRSPSRSADGRNSAAASGKKRLTTWNLVALSVSMLGAQIAWSVELGYGTPFLLRLGLSETMTSLVWLAGPISGLIAQPLIGAISDSSTSKYRRRYWIVSSTIALVLSLTMLSECESIAALLVDIFNGGEGDWDPARRKRVPDGAIAIAVIALYLLDFALNALQASLRNLLLDICPAEQLSLGNAWHGRMTHAGNIVGYTIGFLPLAKIPLIRFLGGDQFHKFCILSMIILVATVWITCATQDEKPGETQLARGRKQGKLAEIWSNIRVAIVQLPRPIRRVCYVQVFAFMGWFPFLFYSTTYVGQVMAYETGEEPDPEYATRTGELGMLFYSIVAVVAGTILPLLARRDARLLGTPDDEDEDAELARLRNQVMEWKAEAASQGRPLKLPMMPFLLRNIWMGALVLFTVLTFSTFFISTVYQAIAMISLVGICWAIACWVPFAIIMEIGPPARHNTRPGFPGGRRPSHTRVLSTPAYLHRDEREPLLRARSVDDSDAVTNDDALDDKTPNAGGTVLGIHNLAIVMPQFIIAVVSSLIFRIADADLDDDPKNHHQYLGKNGVAWVLRFGGLCTLFGALMVRRVPPTRTEKGIRRRLALLQVLKDAGTP